MAGIDDWQDVPEADDWQDVVETPPKEKPSLLQSTVGGIAQGITLGYSDEIEAKITSALGDKTYDEVLAEVRQRHKEQREAHPVAFGIGEIGSSIAPGSAIAKGVSGAVKAGAAIGAIQAAGTTEEKVTESPLEFAKDVTIGAGLGGVAGKIGEVIEPASKWAIKKATSYVSPTKLRADALARTRKQLKADIDTGTDFEDVVKAGEDIIAVDPKLPKGVEPPIGVFRKTIDESLRVTKATKDKVGKELGELVKGDLGARSKHMEFFNTISVSKEELKDNLTELAGKGAYTSKELETATSFIDETFKKINALGLKTNTLQAVRDVRINLSKKLNSGDFLPGGKKAGTKRDVLTRQIAHIRDLEARIVNKLKTHLKGQEDKVFQDPSVDMNTLSKNIGAINAYEPLMKQYSTLATLEDAMTLTKLKGMGNMSPQEAITSVGSSAIGAMLYGGAGVPIGIAKAFYESSGGKLLLASIIRSKKPASLIAIAKKLKVGVDELSKSLDARGIKIEEGVLSAAGANQLLRQLKEEDK